MITTSQLQHRLGGYIGTMNYYTRFPFVNNRYTDGVKAFADLAEAHWLINDIFIFLTEKQFHNEDFVCITFNVKDNKGELTFDDGNDKVLKRFSYSFTDCPEGIWKFYFTDNVLLLPNEY